MKPKVRKPPKDTEPQDDLTTMEQTALQKELFTLRDRN